MPPPSWTSAASSKQRQRTGLLGLAFDPHYATNGYFYIVYTDQSAVGDDVLARYKVSSATLTWRILRALKFC